MVHQDMKRVPIEGLSKNDLRQMVEETPASGKHRGVIAIAGVATLGSLLFGYDTGLFPGRCRICICQLGLAVWD